MPFLVRWPGVVPRGAVSGALFSQVDLFATLAAAAGATPPAGQALDSFDQLAVWKDPAVAGPRRTIVHNTNAQGYALRHDHWLLVAAKSGGVSAVPPWFNEAHGYGPNPHPGELYDLSRDLAQRQNLYADQPARVAELQALLAQVRARGQVR